MHIISCRFLRLPGPHKDHSRIDGSLGWKHVRVIKFVENVRCKDEVLNKKVRVLRIAPPSKKLLGHISDSKHRAWTTSEPTAWDILDLMRRTNETTTILSCIRLGAAKINNLAVQVLFADKRKRSLATLPLDFETNPENYDEQCKFIVKRAPSPAMTNVYEGMRIYLTRNLNKDEGFVNGMGARVMHYNHKFKCLEVITEQHKRLAVYLYNEDVENCGRVSYFRIRISYAGAVQKAQGATLSHVTFWPDKPGCRAAAYVALSRVQHDNDYLVGGRVTRP